MGVIDELDAKEQEILDKIDEGIDNVEDNYIDPLKDKIDQVAEKPLSWLDKNGRKAALYFTIGVVALGLIYTGLKYIF